MFVGRAGCRHEGWPGEASPSKGGEVRTDSAIPHTRPVRGGWNAGSAGGGGTAMTLELVVMWVVVGLLAGWVAGYIMKDGGYGLKGDLILGVVGSIVGGWLFSVLG